MGFSCRLFGSEIGISRWGNARIDFRFCGLSLKKEELPAGAAAVVGIVINRAGTRSGTIDRRGAESGYFSVHFIGILQPQPYQQ